MSNYRISLGCSHSDWVKRDLKKQLDRFLSQYNVEYCFIQKVNK